MREKKNKAFAITFFIWSYLLIFVLDSDLIINDFERFWHYFFILSFNDWGIACIKWYCLQYKLFFCFLILLVILPSNYDVTSSRYISKGSLENMHRWKPSYPSLRLVFKSKNTSKKWFSWSSQWQVCNTIFVKVVT